MAPSTDIAVVIPCFREPADSLDRCLGSVRDGGTAAQVLVVGCENEPDIAQVCTAHGAGYHLAPRGRGPQQNWGVAQLDPGIGRLLFLHSDTLLPGGWSRELNRVLDSGAVLGAFSLAFGEVNLRLTLVELAANLRSRALHLPFGDQALFLRRGSFEELGGFAALDFMEDLDLVHRAARLGPVVTARLRVRSSSRRYRMEGTWRTSARHYALAGAFLAGWRPGQESHWRHHLIARLAGKRSDGRESEAGS